jgi:hypothetical protein
VVLAVLAAGHAVMTLTPGLLGDLGVRLATPGEYDSLAARGYDRIVNHPEYLFFGAGEGAYERFKSELYPWGEIHSTFGTLLFCYGILGTGLFVCGLFFACRRDLRAALYFLPAFVHGTAHHGGRFAFFWTMLAFVCCCALARHADDKVTS